MAEPWPRRIPRLLAAVVDSGVGGAWAQRGEAPVAGGVRRTLRRRLYLLFLQWLGIFLVVSALITYFTQARFREQLTEDRLLLARTVAQYLDATVAGTLQGLARLAAELPLEEDPRGRLRAHRFSGLFRDALHVMDENGRVLLSEPPYAPPPSREWLRPDAGVTTLVRRSDPARAALLAVQPFRRGGRRLFLVAETRPAGSTLSVLLQDLATGPDLHLVVIDAEATVIAAPDRDQLFRRVEPAGRLGDRILARRPLVAEVRGCSVCPAGGEGAETYVTAMAPLRSAPWGVVIQQSADAAFALLAPSRLGMIAVSGLLVLMGVLLSHGFTRSVIAPIRELSVRAQRLREGDLATPLAVEGDREIHILAASLEEARRRIVANLGDLQQLNEGLEEQVAGRTAELETKLADLRELHAQRRTLVARLLAAGEEERRRIARELHDEIAQLLTVVQLSLDRICPLSGGATSAADGAREVARARELLAKTQAEVHRIVYDLRPSLLDDLGLPAAVRSYTATHLEQRGIEVALQLEEELELPGEVALTAFRVFQEIVTNVLRHAHTESVSIELFVEGADGSRRLVLAVEDDGIGFSPRDQRGGSGLVGMQERAALVGGRIDVDSEPGMGTTVRVLLPLEGTTS
jgi:signal transduction histidine kinase